jgi:phosphoserine phosphatase
MPRNRADHHHLAVPGAPAGIRLVAFDLDGTLTRGQTCMEAIAAALGFADQMAPWEQARTEQELTAARLGMWEHLKHCSSQDITAAIAGIPLAPGGADGIAALRAAGIRTVIVSLTLTHCAAYFARRLGADAHIGTEPDGSGGFRHVFPATKPILLAEHARALGIPPQQVAAAGDSPGDIPMLRAARTSIYVGATVPDGFTPTWHLPQAPIDEIARIILAPDSPDGLPPATQ